MLLALGLGATAVSTAAIAACALRRPPAGFRRPWPWYGWLGLGALALLEGALFGHLSPWVATFFTAPVWTAYIFVVDAAVYRLRGDSWLHHPRAFLANALLSIPGWMVFELYNLRLHNWIYTGVPRSFPVFAAGAAWAFATIYPGIFETAELIAAALPKLGVCTPRRCGPLARGGMALAGAACLLMPLAAPAAWAPYLFAPVWAGFIFFLDPVNHAWGWPSLLGDWERGAMGRFCALLLSGAVCGFLWEFWNYWARARWHYVFPVLPRFRVFAMPAPGFLGFPPFALECFTMAIFLTHGLLPQRWRREIVLG